MKITVFFYAYCVYIIFKRVITIPTKDRVFIHYRLAFILKY